MGRSSKAWISLFVVVAVLAINWMGASGLINDLSQKEVSDRYPTLITPDPATFSIWGLIYTLLIISIVMMIIKSNDAYYGQAIDKITHLFWISSALNAGWIISFSYLRLGLSTLLILAFVVTLALINQRLGEINSGRQWLLPVTFGLYGGWVFIATVVNIAAWLVQLNWQGLGLSQQVWGTYILLISIVLTFVILLHLRNAVFPLPIAWAYLGIYRALTSPGSPANEYLVMQIAALVGVVILVAIAILQFWWNKYKAFPERVSDSQ